jgi:hypothetical protein
VDLLLSPEGRSGLPAKGGNCYNAKTYCAVEVEESASDDPVVKEDAMIFAAIATIAALVLIGLLMLNLIIYALPFAIGLTAGQWTSAAGHSIAVSIASGLGAALLTMLLARIAIGLARSPAQLAIIGLLFAIPAAFAGYHASLGLWALFAEPNSMTHFLASIAALSFGALAWVRLPTYGCARQA